MCLHRADWLGKQADRITCRSIDFSSSFFFKKTGQHQSERHKTEGNGALGVLKPDLIFFFFPITSSHIPNRQNSWSCPHRPPMRQSYRFKEKYPSSTYCSCTRKTKESFNTLVCSFNCLKGKKSGFGEQLVTPSDCVFVDESTWAGSGSKKKLIITTVNKTSKNGECRGCVDL